MFKRISQKLNEIDLEYTMGLLEGKYDYEHKSKLIYKYIKQKIKPIVRRVSHVLYSMTVVYLLISLIINSTFPLYYIFHVFYNINVPQNIILYQYIFTIPSSLLILIAALQTTYKNDLRPFYHRNKWRIKRWKFLKKI